MRGSNRKFSVLAMFLVCEIPKGHGVEDGIVFIDRLDGDIDDLRRGDLVHFEFRNRTRTPPQIVILSPYVFYTRGDGLVADDNANPNVIVEKSIYERGIDGDRGTAPTHSRRVIDHIEHSLSRYCDARDYLWHLQEGRCGIHSDPSFKRSRKQRERPGVLKCVRGLKRRRQR